MKSAFLGAVAALFLGVGWAAAQAPTNGPPAGPYNTGAPLPPGAAPGVANSAPNLGAASVPGTPTAPGLSAACNGAGCNSGPSVYFSADYLLWRVRAGAIPPAATAVPVGLLSVDISNLFTASPTVPGVASGQQILGFAPMSITSTSQFGANSTNYGDLCGFRLIGGWWADCDQTWGIEASLFALERGSDTFSSVAAVSGNQFLLDTGFTRTLFLVSGADQTALSTFQVFAVREVTAQTVGFASNSLSGAELNARCVGLHFGCVDIGGLVGFRYLRYKDELTVLNQVRLFRPEGFPITSGDASASLSQDLTFRTADSIRVWNNFFGAQAGADIDARWGSFFINTRAKVGVGTIIQNADVGSFTQVLNNDPARPQPPSRLASGGLLFGPNDVGSHDRNRFGFVGEVNVKLGYQITECFRAYVGYDGLYMTHMARAGNSSVINTLNTTLRVANSTSEELHVSAPSFRFKEQDIWAQGLNFGVEFRY